MVNKVVMVLVDCQLNLVVIGCEDYTVIGVILGRKHNTGKNNVLFVGVRTDPDLRGVIPNSFEHIFTHIARTQNQQYLVRASYLEIYQVTPLLLGH